MKYIFLAGAPGSKWSSVSADLRGLSEVNTSDSFLGCYTKPGEIRPMHTGAYWDPGMEYGKQFDQLPTLTTDELEVEFDRPFSQIDSRVKIVKSHQFSKFLDNIAGRVKWQYNPIVLVQRSPVDAESWWYEAGGWNISYPSYDWYKGQMSEEIAAQCKGIDKFINSVEVRQVKSFSELAETLGFTANTDRPYSDMDVYVYQHPRLRYFKEKWPVKHRNPFSQSGIEQTLQRIGPDDTVLDVGCGNNLYKPYLQDKVVGIDPSNPAADYMVSIEEFSTDQRFDHVLCYGSINFGSYKQIENQVRCVMSFLKPGSLIHWRLNPGKYDHNIPGQEVIDLFPWDEHTVKTLADKFGCTVLKIEKDNNRLFSLWKKV